MKLSVPSSLLITLLVVPLAARAVVAAPYDLVNTLRGGQDVLAVGSDNLAISQIGSGTVNLENAQTGNIIASLHEPTFDFGQATGSLGDELLVGSIGLGGTPDVVYFFSASGSLDKTLQIATGAQLFLTALAPIGNGFLAAGLPAGANGQVLINNYDTNGNLLQTFSNLGPEPANGLSSQCIAVSGTEFLFANDNQSGSGLATLIDTATGAVVRTFSDPEAANPTASEDGFGAAVAVLPGDRFAISAPRGDGFFGAVYIFDGSTGDLLQTFTGTFLSGFGTSLAVAGDNLLVSGGPSVDNQSEGSVDLYSLDTGKLIHQFAYPGPSQPANSYVGFGALVGTVGSDFYITAPGQYNDGGSVYVFSGVPEPASLLLAAVGMLGILWAGYRRRQAMGRSA